MSTDIVQVETPEAREYGRYLLQIEEQKRRAADLREELESLKLGVGRFEAEYHARVGVLFVELDRMNLAFRKWGKRRYRLEADPGLDPAELERELDAEFVQEREDIRAGDEQNRRYKRVFEQDRARPRLSVSNEEHAQRLFRDLAKRFHPDLARTDEERRRRAEIMQLVNAAYSERNLDALESLFNESEIIDPRFEARSMGDKLVWAIRELARLDGVIELMKAELELLKQTESYELWRRQECGEDVITQLEVDLKREIASYRNACNSIIEFLERTDEQKVEEP